MVEYAEVKNASVTKTLRSQTFFSFLFFFPFLFCFLTKAALYMTNFTMDKSKNVKSNFTQIEHVFPSITFVPRSEDVHTHTDGRDLLMQ